MTDEQKQRLNEHNAVFGRRMLELYGSGGGGNQEARDKLSVDRTEKTLAVLTPEQKDQLKALQGNAFDVSQISSGFGRRGKN